ncbi:hypothetical protein [Phocicoccus pinnipedialis]|uniref:Uncharacterized protein n=1 Tax=Phocicoccus pinnipedialis TaxID=110845 RepID=A0A6V7RAU2_9BACL|nr:hypothetical protein [Jeotgalicoccus pinnipedialis]MBP1939876.1 hypothetical protein [Jeotgalicoccus pinnipedialis]CAD2074665.1 hypothetical protein JEOPIN946_00810 [Jeotgalicoccus pinnipedialis]
MIKVRCGTECFIATIEVNDEIKALKVPARSNPDARKILKRKFGLEVKVLKLVRKVNKE